MVVLGGEKDGGSSAQVRNCLVSARHSIHWISEFIRREGIAGVLLYETREISTL